MPKKQIFRFNLENQKIGQFFVIGRHESKKGNWKCICDCGEKLSIKGTRLVKNERKFCKCQRKKKKENIILPKKCKKCEKEFTPTSKQRNIKYCSKDCYKTPFYLKKCKVCGDKLLEGLPHKGPAQCFCSLKCKIQDSYIINKDKCWILKKIYKKTGYGQINFNHKKYLSHRAAYEIYVKQIDERNILIRRCKNYKCINPSHYEEILQEKLMENCFKYKATKKINEEIVEKIIELYQIGLNPLEIVKEYKEYFKYKHFKDN